MNKVNVINKTQELLEIASNYFSKINGCSQYLPEIDRLKCKLHQPCILAVGGKVKAGKSSFINALLGKQLAKVGELETTATINMFRHISYAGSGYTDEKPVKVVWNNGYETWEDASFMDSLQGTDDATLKKAEGISHLEFYVDDELLRELTLVDTPGTDAIVGKDGKAHQNVVDRFFKLRKQHTEQTNAKIDEADAVIYLVGAVAGAPAKQFLSDFQETASGASALNALGVLSKVDIDETLLAKRHSQAEYVANSLREVLFTVVPISAGMDVAIKNNRDRFPTLQRWLKTIPKFAFDKFMSIDTNYKTEDPTYLSALYHGTNQVPPSLEERLAMKGDLQWALFRAIARELYVSDNIETAIKHLSEIANIDVVRNTINERFFQRSKVIRCNRILKDLQKILLHIKRSKFNELRSNRADYDVWNSIIRVGESYATKSAADALRRFIASQLPTLDEIDKLEVQFIQNLILPLEELQQELEDIDSGFQFLSLLQSRRDLWLEHEYNELCTLFGLYGAFVFPEEFDMTERQAFWQNKAIRLRDRRDQSIAEYAVECYGKRIMNSK